jgi:hypothetical protein
VWALAAPAALNRVALVRLSTGRRTRYPLRTKGCAGCAILIVVVALLAEARVYQTHAAETMHKRP